MEEPDAASLLDIARRTLVDEIIPRLDGDTRFKALMVANALAIAARALTEPPPSHQSGDGTALAAAIRAGNYDPGTPDRAGIATALMTMAEARCRVSAPKALARRR
jgi:hypothetical protein